MQLWRISRSEALDGAGAFYGGGRWNTRGHAVVYLAENPAGAMVEVLAHLALDEMDLPDAYRLMHIEVAIGTQIEDVEMPQSVWPAELRITQDLGDAWLEGKTAAIARVPSAIMPYTWNYLLNPEHPDSVRSRIIEVSQHLYDPRLLRVRGR